MSTYSDGTVNAEIASDNDTRTGGGVFVRQSSGLIREFSLADVVLYNLVGLNLGVVVVVSITALASLWAGASMVLAVVIGAIVSAITVGTYGFMSAAMPRSGGDYVFVSRALSPWIGYLASWMITCSLVFLFGQYSVGVVTYALGPSMAAFGGVAHADWFITAANTLTSDKTALTIAALGFMLLAAATALASGKYLKRVFRLLGGFGLVGLVLALILVWVVGPQGFNRHLNHVLGATHGGTVAGIHAAAVKAGFKPVHFSLSKTIAALPFAFTMYIGLTYSTYLGGEIQKPQRTQPVGMAITLGIAFLFLLTFFAGVYHTMGWDNIHAWAYLASNKPAALTFFGGAPLGSFLIGGLTGSPVLSLLLGVTFLAWTFLLMVFAIMTPTRNLFAWSMDRVIPEAVAKVSRRGTAYVAGGIMTVLAFGVTVVAVRTSFLTLVVNYTLIYAPTFVLTGVAAAAFPYRRSDLFERAPASVRRHIGRVPVVTAAGVLQAAIFAFIILEALRLPAFGGPTGLRSLLLIGGLVVAGPVVFFASRAIRQWQGYDVDAPWRVLPPE